MTKKYKLLTNEVLEWEGHFLYRIQALRDFGNVKADQLGGWIESGKNLSHFGSCWVSCEAKVFGNAKVFGDAWVADYAEVYDFAQVYDNATVYGKAQVFGDAKVCGNILVCDNAKVFGDISTTKNDSNMEKKYKVSIDITMSTNIYVDAENEEKAKQKAIEDVKKDPYFHANSADSLVNCVVTNIVNEDENVRLWLISQLKIKLDATNSDKNDMINKALDYLEKQGGQSVK